MFRPLSRKAPPARRRSFRPLVERLEERAVPATIAWTNAAGGDWSTPGNWNLGRVPIDGDNVVIPDLASPGADITITYNDGTTTNLRSITTAENLVVGANTTLGVSGFGFFNGSLANEGAVHAGFEAVVALDGGATANGGSYVLDTRSYLIMTPGTLGNSPPVSGPGTVEIINYADFGGRTPTTGILIGTGFVVGYNTPTVTLSGTQFPSLVGATFTGSADVTVGPHAIGEPLDWNGVTLNGTGTVTFPPETAVAISGSDYFNQAVINQGYASTADINGAGSITNKAGATLVVGGGDIANPIVNEAGGTIYCGNAFNPTIAGPINNHGMFEVRHGRISLNGGGTNTGTFLVDAGCFVGFNNFTFTSSSVVTGDGNVGFGGYGSTISGTYNVGGTTGISNNLGIVTFDIPSVTIPNLVMGGWLGGPANVTIPNGGSLTWNGGYIYGSGIFTIAHGATATIPGLASVNFGQTMINHGAFTWAGKDVGDLGGGLFINASDGTFDVTAASNPNFLGRFEPQFINEAGARLTRSAGAGSVTFVEIDNAGTVDVLTGLVQLGYLDNVGHVSNSGMITVAAGATLVLRSPFTEEITGSAPGTQYGQISSAGTVDIASSLVVSIPNQFSPSPGQVFRFIDMTAANGVNGSFNWLSEGATIADNYGNIYRISYVGGDGNDVVLSANGGHNASSLQGFVWEDFNDDGQIDFGENGLSGASVRLQGTDVLGNSIDLPATTDANGSYQFSGIFQGTYTITVTPPAGYYSGHNTIGTVNGVPTGSVSGTDQFFVNLGDGVDGFNYNFGERPVNGGTVHSGQTAGIGFWNNNHGQALIKALNGGQNATELGNWLAATFVNIFGANAGSNDLAGMTNAQVASAFQQKFMLHGPKLDAQVMATALSVYVTNNVLAGNVAAAYGFTVTHDGAGVATINIGSDGVAVGHANNSTMSIMDILLETDALSADDHGILYGGNTTLRNAANDLFSRINQSGGI